MAKTAKKLPASENGAATRCVTKTGMEYLISQNSAKQQHTLWKRTSDGLEKIATGGTPYDLYKLIHWDK